MTWWAALPGLVVLSLMWVVPGYAVLRALGVRGLVAWGAGAPVTTGVAALLGIGYAMLGVRWSLGSFALGMAATIVIALVLGHLLGTVRDPAAETVTGQRRTMRDRRWLALTWTIAAVVMGTAMMAGMSGPSVPQQTWDGVFHYNAAWSIQDTGNASTFGGLAPMYGDTIAPYYPAIWHAMVAIAPLFAGVTEAANASSIVLGTVIWISGLVALVRVVWEDRWLPVVFTPLLAASFVTFPTVAISMLGVWPFALSVACTPGALALLIVALRGRQSWRLHLVHGLGGLAAAGGVVMAHGSGLFTLALLAAPMGAVLLARQGRRYARSGHLAPVIVAGALVAVGSLVFGLWLLRFPPIQAIIAYERGGQDAYWGPVGAWLIDHPQIYAYPILSVNLVAIVLIGIGLCITIVGSHARWLGLAYAASLLLLLLAAGPADNPFRVLAGFWYTQPSRINQLLLIPGIVLAAGGAAWLTRWLSRINLTRRRSTLTAMAAVIGLATSFSVVRWAIERHRFGSPEAEPPLTLQALIVVLVAAVCATTVWLALERLRLLRWRLPTATAVVMAILAVSTTGFRWATHEEIVQSVYTQWPIAWQGMLLPEEIEMIDRAATTLPEDAVVLGEPANGSPYLMARSGVEVVFPQLTTIADSPERAVLAAKFDRWRFDPEVCEAVRALGVTHVYTDTLTFEEGAKWETEAPGLRETQPRADAFETVDSGGRATISRFTGCDLD